MSGMENEKIEKRFLFDLNTSYQKNLSGTIIFADTVDNIILAMSILLKNGYSNRFFHTIDYYREQPYGYPYTNYTYIELDVNSKLMIFTAIKYEEDIRGEPHTYIVPDYVKEYKL